MDREDRLKTLREEAIADIDNSISEIGEDALWYLDKATKELRIHATFSAIVAVLGVAAPALVTYQTQVEDPLFKLLAIILTAIVGASTALQATFRWSDQYRRSYLTALDLEELKSDAETQKIYLERTTDDLKAYEEAKELNQASKNKRSRIKREHVKDEIAIVTHSKDHQPASERAENPARSHTIQV